MSEGHVNEFDGEEMDLKRLNELLERFRCAGGCDALSVKELTELRDGLSTWQTSLVDEADEKHLEKIGQLQAVMDEVGATIDAARAEFATKVAGAKGEPEAMATEAVATDDNVATDEDDEDVDLSKFQPAKPAAPNDEKPTIKGKVLVATGMNQDGATVFEGAIDSSLDLTKALQRAVGRYGAGAGTDGMIPVVRGTYDMPEEFMISNEDPHQSTAIMMKAIKAYEDRQAELALTADGGFCAPVTPDYTFCDMSDGNFDLFQASLPRVGTIRGRVQYMQTPTNDQFFDQWGGLNADTFAGVGTAFDETDSLAVDPDNDATWKGFVEVDCPTQQDPAEIAAHYTNVRYRHFTWKAFPEYVDLYVRKALVAHNLKESISLYNQVVAVSETVTGVEAVPGNVAGFFTALDTQFAAYRDAFWLPRDQVIDTVLPRWVLNVLRTAIARKAVDEVAALQVTDATINGLFASINVRVNFVSGINRLAVSTDGASNQLTPIVPTVGVNLWPDSVPVLAWVPGTVVLLNQPDWNIGIERIRDTILQRQNAYGLFAETFSGLAYPCPYPVQQFDVAFCPAGESVERVTIDCATVAAPQPS